ncbi:1959_t:CDS:1, partial [Racocetra fulgida]
NKKSKKKLVSKKKIGNTKNNNSVSERNIKNDNTPKSITKLQNQLQKGDFK